MPPFFGLRICSMESQLHLVMVWNRLRARSLQFSRLFYHLVSFEETCRAKSVLTRVTSSPPKHHHHSLAWSIDCNLFGTWVQLLHNFTPINCIVSFRSRVVPVFNTQSKLTKPENGSGEKSFLRTVYFAVALTRKLADNFIKVFTNFQGKSTC